jgi:bacillopeptidase F (M6 metalloprotease family)
VISRLLYSSASAGLSPKVDSASARIAANLQKLKDLMVSIKKEKVADLFPEGSVVPGDGDQLIDKDLFQKKLVTDVLLKLEEASEIVSVILCLKDLTKVSLNKVEEQLANLHSVGKPEKEAMTAAKADEIVNEVFDHLKRFLAMNEVNLVDLFIESEEGDSYFDRQELSRAFQKCRFVNQGPQHEERMEAIFIKFDPMRTRKIDFMLFLKTFYQKANSTRAPPPSASGDKLLYVYENVRKYL